jgi:phosphoglycolate phosphatase (TIGR01487 family)
LAGSRRRPRAGEVRAVAVDVDGTLTDESRRVGLDAVAALRKVEDSGVPVMLASGNVLPIAYALSVYLGFNGPIIAENGGIVCCDQKVFFQGEPREPKAAYKKLLKEIDAPRLFTDKWRVTEIALRPIVKFGTVKRILRGMDVDVATSGYAIHIMTKGMNKLVGVRKACDILSLPLDSVAAIGDADNDMTMISGCGFGVAVGNAFVGTKRVASHVTRGKNGKGVVEALEWLRLV